MTYLTPTQKDAQRCWNLLNALDYETEYMLYEPGERTPDTSRIEAQLANANTHPENTLFLAAEINGELVAFLSANRAPHLRTAHTAYIVCGVRKQYHRQGIATTLFTHLDLWAKKYGLTRLELTVSCENTAAIHLYQKNGFEIEGTRRNSIQIRGTYKDEYDMSKIYPEEP